MPSTHLDVLAGRARWSVEIGDSLEWVERLPARSVHCCVSSPPYFNLRDYGAEGQIGLEDTPEQYIAQLVRMFRGVKNAMHPSGMLWLNLGDSYAAGGGFAPDAPSNVAGSISGGQDRGTGTKTGARQAAPGYKPKDLIGIPWMAAFALRADGWYLRQAMPWVKRASMPESVDDRPATACEMVFLLSKRADYYFDMNAVKRRAATEWAGADMVPSGKYAKEDTSVRTAAGGASRNNRTTDKHQDRHMRNTDWWFDSVGMLVRGGNILGFDVGTARHPGAHTAVMPEAMVTECVLAGTSREGVCPKCGCPIVPITESEKIMRSRPTQYTDKRPKGGKNNNIDLTVQGVDTRVVGWEPSCSCPEAADKRQRVPAVVIDPFTGAGTTGAVALRLGRRFIGCELNKEYAAGARKRLGNTNIPLV